MIVDMHVHTAQGSPCAEADIMDYMHYLEQLRVEGRGVDALVITEHGSFPRARELDHELSAAFGILILRGVEVNTDYCHMLIYGITDDHWEQLSWAGERTLKARDVIRTALSTEGIVAIPAHPFRACPVGGHRDFSGVSIIEVYNGGNNDTQDLRARELAQSLNCRAIAGSDAHRAEELGRCATEFDAPIQDMEELVVELKRGNYRALKRTDNGPITFQNLPQG